MPQTLSLHTGTWSGRSSQITMSKFLTLCFSIFAISLHFSPAAAAAASTGDHSLSDDDVYNYYFNDHSSNDKNDASNTGFTTDGSDLDPFHHNNEYAIDLAEEWAKIGSRVRKPKCVDIPENMTLCHGIGYQSMMLPNILEHDTLSEVTAQASSWVPLINIHCHPDAQVFLCSLFSPVCLDRLIYPCRSLCQDVHDNCIYRMKAHGFDWPKMLQCDRFPVDNDMCIKLIHKVTADNNCTACRHPLTYESLVDHFCRADIVMKVTVKSFNDVLGNRELVLRKKKTVYKYKGIRKSEARKLTPVLEGGVSCVCNTINATQERYLLMGKRRGDKMVLIFGIPWKKKDKEFRKGLRVIRKSSNCEGIFNELSQHGIDKRGGLSGKTPPSKKGKGRKKGKGKGGRKKGRKGKKGRKRKGKGKGKKGKKGRKRKKNRKGNKKGKNNNTTQTTNTASRPVESQKEKWAREDQALDNFMKAAN